ncbi:MAG: ABC transporter permease [Anaerosomatales bacterium]|nr:ABC transporter permease [Anaerosomatales bacterium]
MRGFWPFLRKELREIVRTWRIWVLPSIVLVFALSGPLLAKVMPDILRSMSSDQLGGAVIQLPEPTWKDAYAQWVKNLTQIVTFALLIMLGGVVASEVRSGTAVMVLAKPVSRPAFVLAKAAASAVLVTATAAVGAATTWAVTLAVFGEAPARELVEPTAVWIAWAMLLVAVMTLASALLSSPSGAAGLGIGFYAVLSIASLSRWVVEHTPAGLIGAPAALLAGERPPLAWPLATAALLAAAALALAAARFSHREL